MQTGETDLNKLVPIRTGLDRSQADLLKANLEGHGVPAFLANENIGSLNFVVHTDLLVRAKNWKDAEQLLSKIDAIPASRFSKRFDPDGEEYACQHCGSMRVHPFVGEVPTWLPGLKLKAVPEQTWFHCMECDSYYREKRSSFISFPIAMMWSLTLGAFVLGLYFLIQWLRFL